MRNGKSKDRTGFSLIEIAIILIMAGLLMVLGTGFMIRFIKWQRHKKLEDYVLKNADNVIDIAISYHYLPDNLTSSDLGYLKAQKLTKDYLSSKNATICDIKDTQVRYVDNATNTTLNNVAFVVFSKGEDGVSNTSCDHQIGDGICSPNSTITTDLSKDIVHVVTLPELKERLRCEEPPLKILNRKLST
jgi:type II secretory pathway pseudopilin PulG